MKKVQRLWKKKVWKVSFQWKRLIWKTWMFLGRVEQKSGWWQLIFFWCSSPLTWGFMIQFDGCIWFFKWVGGYNHHLEKSVGNLRSTSMDWRLRMIFVPKFDWRLRMLGWMLMMLGLGLWVGFFQQFWNPGDDWFRWLFTTLMNTLFDISKQLGDETGNIFEKHVLSEKEDLLQAMFFQYFHVEHFWVYDFWLYNIGDAVKPLVETSGKRIITSVGAPPPSNSHKMSHMKVYRDGIVLLVTGILGGGGSSKS